jgi:hypothetical protein
MCEIDDRVQLKIHRDLCEHQRNRNKKLFGHRTNDIPNPIIDHKAVNPVIGYLYVGVVG